MAVTVNELIRRTGEQTGYRLAVSRTFQVITDSTAAPLSEAAVLASPGLPKYGEQLLGDDGVGYYCTKQTPTQDPEHDFIWTVKCDYAYMPGVTWPGLPPWKQAPSISGSTTVRQRAVRRAYRAYQAYSGDAPLKNGAAPYWKYGDNAAPVFGTPRIPVENSVGFPFDNPLMEDDDLLTLTIQRNEYTSDSAERVKWIGNLLQFRKTVNNAVVRICGVDVPPLCAKLKGLSWQDAIYRVDGILQPYWVITYTIEIDFETHIQFIPDAGYYYNGPDPANPTKTTRLTDVDADGNPVKDPIKFDLHGGRKADQADGNCYYIGFLTKFDTDWTMLGLPKEMPTRP